jgi:hypothetical protein
MQPEPNQTPSKMVQVFVIGTVLTFITNGILVFVSERLQLGNGTVEVIPMPTSPDHEIVAVIIQNSSNNMLDGLLLATPQDTNPDSIFANFPVIITANTAVSGTNQSLYTISGIPGKASTIISIPSSPTTHLQGVKLVNYSDLKLQLVDSTAIRTPLQEAVSRAIDSTLAAMLVYGTILYAIFRYILGKVRVIKDTATEEYALAKNEMAELRETMEQNKAIWSKSQSDNLETVNSLKADISLHNKRLARVRAWYIRANEALRAENTFYQRLFIAFLTTGGASMKSASQLVVIIRTLLGTEAASSKITLHQHQLDQMIETITEEEIPIQKDRSTPEPIRE